VSRREGAKEQKSEENMQTVFCSLSLCHSLERKFSRKERERKRKKEKEGSSCFFTMSAPPLGTLYALPASLFEGARRLGAAAGAGEAAGAAESKVNGIANGDPTTTTAVASSSSSAAALDAADAAGLTCACCGVVTRGSSSHLPFASPEAQREHFKSDWHRLNARRRAKALSSSSRSSSSTAAVISSAAFSPLSEEAAAELLESAGAGDASDVSSLSGSDSEEEDDESDDGDDEGSASDYRRKRGAGAASSPSPSPSLAALVPLVSSDGRPFALWRPLLFAPRRASFSDASAEPAAAAAASSLRGDRRCWAVILAKGGHFAAAAFDVSDPPRRGEPLEKYPRPLAHGTAHRYVVRAKAGGRQSTKDAAGGGAGAIKSAGSSLRRYNERALEADIKRTLADFGDLLSPEKCALIFVHAPGQANAASLFGGGGSRAAAPSPAGAPAPRLWRGDPRIRSVPFAVRRPTLSEAGRVARGLLTVHSVSPLVEKKEGDGEGAAAAARQQRKQEAAAAAATVAAAAAAAAAAPPPLPLLPDPPLVAAAKAGDAELVASLLAEFAAGDGQGAGVRGESGGPEQREARPGGRTAYDCASSKAVRDAFRRAAAAALEAAAAAGVSEGTQAAIAAAWAAAGVPSALTAEMEEAQQRKAAEKKARARAAERERKKATAAKKAAQAAEAAAEEDAAIEAAAAEAAALSLNK